MIPFPEATEYSSYYSSYILHLKGEDVISALDTGVIEVNDLMASLTKKNC